MNWLRFSNPLVQFSTFPVVLRVSPGVLQNLWRMEKYASHTVSALVAARHKNKLEIRDEMELRHVVVSLNYWGEQGFVADDVMTGAETAAFRRLADKLRALAPGIEWRHRPEDEAEAERRGAPAE